MVSVGVSVVFWVGGLKRADLAWKETGAVCCSAFLCAFCFMIDRRC
jgi:hypothetical protein